MTTKNEAVLEKPALKLVVARTIQAPSRMVYAALTDPKQMVQWWSPEDIACRSVTADLKMGGAYRIHMTSVKGDHFAFGKYTEIVPNKRLRFTWQWENYAMPDSVVTIELEDLGKTTHLTLTHEGLPDEEDVVEHKHGWTSLVEKFARLMAENKIKIG